MPAVLITVPHALAHLRLSATDPDLELKMLQAEATVVQYIASSSAYWADQAALWTSPATVPPIVQAAILCQLGELYRFRGDDLDGQGPARDPAIGDLSPVVVSLLRRYRDPVLA